LERYEIITILNDILSPSQIVIAKNLKWVRDNLSHGKPLSAENISVACENWERVLERANVSL
jgi:hypothetical protein